MSAQVIDYIVIVAVLFTLILVGHAARSALMSWSHGDKAAWLSLSLLLFSALLLA